MEQILINIDSQYSSAFLAFLKTLSYVEVKEVGQSEVNKVEDKSVLFTLSGAWKDSRSAEEMIEDIYESRHFEKTIPSL
jgi:hypothetical protein